MSEKEDDVIPLATPNTKQLAEETVEDYVNSMFSF